MKLGVGAALLDGELVPGDVEVVDGRLERIGLDGTPGRGLVIPGFVDLQVNGYAGIDFLSADSAGYRVAGEALVAGGVTAFQPTLITSPEEVLVAALKEVPARAGGARVIGAHLEGPFLSPQRIGAHPQSSRRDPDQALLERLLAAGPVSMMTLAPELPGALELIDLLRARRVVVSGGHTDATADEAERAFERGMLMLTHLFNAMRPFQPRDPGIAGAALGRADVAVGLIVDGHHLAPQTVRLVWRAVAGRVALVTDAMAGAGMGDGKYELGRAEIEVRDGAARLPDGVLAGSVLSMIQAVRNLVALGVPLAAALDAATTVPARIVGRPELGRLALGKRTDFVVLDDELEVKRVLLAESGDVSD